MYISISIIPSSQVLYRNIHIQTRKGPSVDLYLNVPVSMCMEVEMIHNGSKTGFTDMDKT